MSNRYKGGVISATPPTTTGGESGTASGAWTLEQQMQAQAAGLWPSPPPPLYIEDVFSTYLYTGTGAAQTITNGINLSGKGGMVWMKGRNSAINGVLCDTVRSRQYYLISDAIVVQQGPSTAGRDLSTFNSNGFSLGVNENVNINANGTTMASWTFREQPKFFDVVTYNGTGVDMAVNHNLQAQPGCVMIKRLNQNSDWNVMFPGLIADGYGGTGRMSLNKTDAYSATGWTSVANSTQITIPTNTPAINEVGGTYVAYLFASNAGGFGLAGTENGITCGKFTTPASGDATITLGYEPQWLLVKSSSNASDWYMVDTMRGFSQTSQSRLDANTTAAEEINAPSWFRPTATGFTAASGSIGGSRDFVYIAIRRGPMAIPTSGTTVFAPVTYTGNNTSQTLVTNFPVDFFLTLYLPGSEPTDIDRLRGFGTATGQSKVLFTMLLAAEAGATSAVTAMTNTTVNLGTWSQVNYGGQPYASWNFGRAPGFMDMVCYTGTGSATAVTHNLKVAPELILIKNRSISSQWRAWSTYITQAYDTSLRLNSDAAVAASGYTLWASSGNLPSMTSATFSIGATNDGNTNSVGENYIAYLFATLAGVSKVGQYTGTGATQTINCGFFGGARFVLIKRTDTTGDWWLWDTGRGMVSGNDSRINLNTSTAQQNNDWVFTTSVGFQIVTADAGVNASGGTYIFLAIA